MAPDRSNQIVLRWDSPASCAPLLSSGGIDAVWLSNEDANIAADCRAAGVEAIPPDAIRVISPEDLGNARAAQTVAVNAGRLPGAEAARRPADGAFIAGATTRTWITANGYLVAWLRALFPEMPPILAYPPDSGGAGATRALPFGSLELALVDAWTAGGNCILSPDAPYREALLAGNKMASDAWAQMGRTARWLKEHRSLFRQPPLNAITVLIEPGETTAEIANLMFRESASPELIPARRAPARGLALGPIVVAAGLAAPPPELRLTLAGHAGKGATVVTDAFGSDAWWRAHPLRLLREYEDRQVYMLGSGRIVAYKQPVSDPGEFALDVIDLAGDRRPARLWNCPGAIAIATQAGAGISPALHVINYGSPNRGGALARRYGVFRSATLLRPDAPPLPLRTHRRGDSTEVMLPGLNRMASVVFE